MDIRGQLAGLAAPAFTQGAILLSVFFFFKLNLFYIAGIQTPGPVFLASTTMLFLQPWLLFIYLFIFVFEMVFHSQAGLDH